MKYALATAVVGCLAVPSIGSAQTADFTGTWTYDAAKSTGVPELVSIGGSEGTAARGRAAGTAPGAVPPAGRGRAARTVDSNRLVIKQTPAEINLLDGGVALRFMLDGSENSVSALNRPGYPKGKAAWEGGKLVLSTSQQVYIGKAQFAPRTTRWVYSVDAGVLTIDKTEVSPQGETKNEKLVYSKATT